MTIFQSMVKDEIDELEDIKNPSTSEKRRLAILDYLKNLIDKYLDDNDISDATIYTAPNGKKYTVIFDKSKSCYTSPVFLNKSKCFYTRTEFNNFVDINNPARTHTVDTSWSTATHYAPSGKSYTIQKTTD